MLSRRMCERLQPESVQARCKAARVAASTRTLRMSFFFIDLNLPCLRFRYSFRGSRSVVHNARLFRQESLSDLREIFCSSPVLDQRSSVNSSDSARETQIIIVLFASFSEAVSTL